MTFSEALNKPLHAQDNIKPTAALSARRWPQTVAGA